jgi:hypothetical protein
VICPEPLFAPLSLDAGMACTPNATNGYNCRQQCQFLVHG